MRNPTNQVEFMVTETLVMLRDLKNKLFDKFE